MNKLFAGIIALLLMMSVSSCHLWQKGARKHEIIPIADSLSNAMMSDSTRRMDTALSANDTAAIRLNAEKKALIAGIMPLWNNRINYNTFNGKAKVHYDGKDQQQDFAASIRMERDKKIWVSITALGLVEVARLVITPDTIILINRLKKEVTVLPFKEAGKLLSISVDFGTLQGLLIGDALHASEDKPTDIASFGGGISVALTTPAYQQNITYNKADSTIRQQQLKVSGAASTMLLMQYGDYTMISDKHFSNSRVINVQDTSGHHYIDMQFNKADFDQTVDFSFSIPSKYTRK